MKLNPFGNKQSLKKNSRKNNLNKPQTSTSKKKSSPHKFAFSYSIIPTNFINLSEEAQIQRLGQFFDILNVIDDRIKITMSRRMVPITVEGQIQNMPVMQVHLESHTPIADTLEQNRLEYISGVVPPNFQIKKEHFSMMELVEVIPDDTNNNNDDYDETNTGEKIFSKTFTLDEIPATLPYAWITRIFDICSQIQMWYNPLDKDEAITRMVRFKNIIYDDAKSNRVTSELFKRADDAENSLRKDTTRLYEVVVNCTVVGRDRKSLKENCKTFKKHLKRYGGHFSAVSAKQASMLYEGFGKKITFDRGSCAILYSFASADMLEIPDGIPLGINMDSKGPIIFDIGKRTNYNIAIIGKSGSGKSFTVKILLNRLLKKFPESYVYVIDPMGEYSKIADFFGMDILYLKDEKEQLGLDPFVLLEPLDAADILAEITNAPADVKRQFQTYCGKAKTFEEFFEMIPKKYKDSLINLKKGPLSRIILGEPKLNSQRKVIMSMEGATGSETEQMILLLLLNKIFKICNDLPARTRKIVLIDEAWMLLRMNNAAKYVNMIVRMGRKLNITFVFISQRLEDISKEDDSGIGKIIDNMETKIILGLEEQAAETARTVLRLSDSETNKIRAFNAGHALFLTKNHRIHAKFMPTLQEREMFDTRPLE
ncbi:MAG: ATP-binding protein [Nitrosopumilus sp.]|nr:ATP-binding protein [Nitrosopumilus sp.]MDH3779626.1 ATP-binding protein [Nitrosopumilus sp.]MDH3854813.1 ATP-binding protein [Nitrosopumilus sp.]